MMGHLTLPFVVAITPCALNNLMLLNLRKISICGTSINEVILITSELGMFLEGSARLSV